MSPVDDPLLSPDWFRVAALKPQLRPGLWVAVQRVRGRIWHVITDPVSGRHHRFNAVAHRLLAACDGERTLDRIWADRLGEDGDDAPSQGETMRLVAQAFQANLLTGEVGADIAALLRREAQVRRRERLKLNPLAFRIGLFDPDPGLERLAPMLGGFQHPGWRWLLGLLLAAIGLLALSLAPALAAEWQRQIQAAGAAGSGASATPSRLLLLAWLAWPVVKLLHEAAHALMVKRHGGAVHEVGIAVLLGNPSPYVDASASAAFPRRGARVAVAAAGIVAELLVAGLALLLWALLEPGLARDGALAVVMVAGGSALLVNGNPLLRFDGYHLMCEAAGLPNLAERSLGHWAWLLRRHGLGLTEPADVQPAPGERPWLVLYAPLSWLARGLLMGWMALQLADFSATLGLALLALALWQSLGAPLWRVGRWLASAEALIGRRGRALAAASAAVLLLGSALVALPLPDRTEAVGVVWLPDEATLRIESPGRVVRYAATDGAEVAAGDVIAVLENTDLVLELRLASIQLALKQVERLQHFERDPAGMAAAEDEIQRLKAEVARITQRVAALTVRAPIAGRLVLDARRRPAGSHLNPGEVLAHVLPADPPMVRALVDQADIQRVRARPGRIEVALAHDDGDPLPARLEATAPAAGFELPSPALGQAGGGPLALSADDPAGRTAREPHLRIDLRLPPGVEAHVGTRARVSIRHGEASAAVLIGRAWRRAFLRHFER